MGKRTDDPLAEAVPRLLAERDLSLRALARAADVDPGFLHKVINGRDSKSAGPKLARALAAALDLPDDYFLEARRGEVIQRLNEDPALVNEAFDRLPGSGQYGRRARHSRGRRS